MGVVSERMGISTNYFGDYADCFIYAIAWIWCVDSSA